MPNPIHIPLGPPRAPLDATWTRRGALQYVRRRRQPSGSLDAAGLIVAHCADPPVLLGLNGAPVERSVQPGAADQPRSPAIEDPGRPGALCVAARSAPRWATAAPRCAAAQLSGTTLPSNGRSPTLRTTVRPGCPVRRTPSPSREAGATRLSMFGSPLHRHVRVLPNRRVPPQVQTLFESDIVRRARDIWCPLCKWSG